MKILHTLLTILLAGLFFIVMARPSIFQMSKSLVLLTVFAISSVLMLLAHRIQNRNENTNKFTTDANTRFATYAFPIVMTVVFNIMLNR